LNAYDCENPTGPKIIADAPLWQVFARSRLEKSSLVMALDPAPSDTADEVRFRPNGRVFSADADLSDDDAIIAITSVTDAIKAHVLVDAATLVCVFPAGKTPPGTGNNRSCL
jgi:hypothetical protein